MQTVQQLLDRKGWGVYSVTPSTTVYDAMKLLELRNVGAALVLESDRIVGILSERDCVRRVLLVRHGGYAPARASFSDDVTLARHLASRGARVGFLDGRPAAGLPAAGASHCCA